MRSYLKTYILSLNVLSPTFIGSGQSINKKEYIFLPNQKKAIIPSLHKMYSYLAEKGHAKAFENYLLNESTDLHSFLRRVGITEKEYSIFGEYSVLTGNAVFDDRSKKEINLFVKDAYGKPYIPGSSIKGAIRTILLGNEVIENPQKYGIAKQEMQNEQFKGKKSYMSRPIKSIENKAFSTLPYEKSNDAAKDRLRGLRFGDSNPISTDNLVLCQKIDISTKGKEKPINTLRECIKPGTVVEFPLTIDSDIFEQSAEDIIKAVDTFNMNYRKCFLNEFSNNQSYGSNVIYLGGGAGYATKTVLYPLFGKVDGLKQVARIMRNTTPPNHHHEKDEEIGASPHMKKCTKYSHTLHEFGACQISIRQV